MTILRDYNTFKQGDVVESMCPVGEIRSRHVLEVSSIQHFAVVMTDRRQKTTHNVSYMHLRYFRHVTQVGL